MFSIERDSVIRHPFGTAYSPDLKDSVGYGLWFENNTEVPDNEDYFNILYNEKDNTLYYLYTTGVSDVPSSSYPRYSGKFQYNNGAFRQISDDKSSDVEK